MNDKSGNLGSKELNSRLKLRQVIGVKKKCKTSELSLRSYPSPNFRSQITSLYVALNAVSQPVPGTAS